MQCDADIEINFIFAPWSRALQLVKYGDVAAAFISSYKVERTEYGVYPLKDGDPDESRAFKRYAYNAYVRKGSKNETLLKEGKIQGLRVAAERGASIIPVLKKRGAKIHDVAKFLSMLRLVATGNIDAAVGIDTSLDPILHQQPDLAALIKKVEPPIQKKVGYIMFSKIFYAKHGALVECFWSRSAQLRDTEWFKTMRATYK